LDIDAVCADRSLQPREICAVPGHARRCRGESQIAQKVIVASKLASSRHLFRAGGRGS